jgi:hypothetical protein
MQVGEIMTPRPFACALVLVATALAGPGANAQQSPAGKPTPGKPAAQGSRTQSEQPARPPGSGAVRGQSDNRLRENIAVLVNFLPAYRPQDDGGAVKLHNAQIAGPFEHTPLWGDKQTFYCVRADVDPVARLFSGTKTTIVTVEHRDGKVRLGARAAGRSIAGPQCSGEGYRPFPELEERRNKVRRALGKPM